MIQVRPALVEFRSGALKRGLIVAAMAASVVVSACGGGSGGTAGGTTVKGSEYKFDPATITVDAGKPVTLTFQNTGAIEHDWKAEGVPGAEVPPTAAKQSKNVSFTPATPGTYKTLCTLPGHAEAGMVGQLIVK